MTLEGVTAPARPLAEVREFDDWASAAEHWLTWLLFPRDFDVQSSRGAVASLIRRRDVLLHEFRNHTIGDWSPLAGNASAVYLFRPMARIAFPIGAKTAGRTQDDWRKVILETVIQRQLKYGQDNILLGAWVGVVVRISDKVARLDNMVQFGRGSFADDSVADAWLDVVGYSLVACLVATGSFQLPLTHLT